MKKILIVEDETFLIEMYKTKFEIENFQVISAISSEQAIGVLKKDIPDLILLDILLPKKKWNNLFKRNETNKESF
jgi:two-component system alkaline phosphatase synthesis response regulator PhoP